MATTTGSGGQSKGDDATCSFLAACSDSQIKIWSTASLNETNTEPASEYSPSTYGLNKIAWNHNNKLIASVGESGSIVLTQPNGNVVQTLSSTVNVKGMTSNSSNPEELHGVVFSSNSRMLCTVGSDPIIKLWDLKKSEICRIFKGNKAGSNCIKWSPSEQHLASGGENGEVLLHSITTGQAVATLVQKQYQAGDVTKAAVVSISYSPYKKSSLATASDDGSIVLWDVHARSIVVNFGPMGSSRSSGIRNQLAHGAPASEVVFSPTLHHSLFSAGLDKRILQFDILTKRSLVRAISTESPLTCMSIEENGHLIAAGTSSGSIYGYDIRASTNTPLFSIPAFSSTVNSIQFSNAVAGNSTDKRRQSIVPIANKSALSSAPAPGPKASAAKTAGISIRSKTPTSTTQSQPQPPVQQPSKTPPLAQPKKAAETLSPTTTAIQSIAPLPSVLSPAIPQPKQLSDNPMATAIFSPLTTLPANITTPTEPKSVTNRGNLFATPLDVLSPVASAVQTPSFKTKPTRSADQENISSNVPVENAGLSPVAKNTTSYVSPSFAGLSPAVSTPPKPFNSARRKVQPMTTSSPLAVYMTSATNTTNEPSPTSATIPSPSSPKSTKFSPSGLHLQNLDESSADLFTPKASNPNANPPRNVIPQEHIDQYSFLKSPIRPTRPSPHFIDPLPATKPTEPELNIPTTTTPQLSPQNQPFQSQFQSSQLFTPPSSQQQPTLSVMSPYQFEAQPQRQPTLSSVQQAAVSQESQTTPQAPQSPQVIQLQSQPQSTPVPVLQAQSDSATSQFHAELVKNQLNDSLSQFHTHIYQDIQNLHLEVLRQFQLQQGEIMVLFEKYNMQQQLLTEIEKLRAENQHLRSIIHSQSSNLL